MQRIYIPILFLLLLVKTGFAQRTHPALPVGEDTKRQEWIATQYSRMSLREKIGQLFMVDVFSEKDTAHTNAVKKLIANYQVGGLIFSKGGPVRQATLTNECQKLSKTPLLIAMDAEWGLAMRLDSTFAYPWNMTLGAVEDPSLIEKVGFRIGAHLKRIGVHLNFAPDVDINTNPKNPIIGNRAFGEDRENVTQKALAFTRGMQKAGVLACAKHFPGHGDTETDSHKALPTIAFSKERIDSVELYPYRELIKEKIASVMVGHLNVPSLENRESYPSSLSEPIITHLLKEQMGYGGLIITDALNMKGVSGYTTPGEVDLAAFLAGNDMLLMSEDVPKAIEKLEEAYRANTVTEERLAYSVKKILETKYNAGLYKYQPVPLKNLAEDLHTLEDDLLYDEIAENAITLIKNEDAILPVKTLEDKKIAYIHMGDAEGSYFLQALQKYAPVDEIHASMLDELLTKLDAYNLVIIGLHRSDKTPWRAYQFTDQELVWLYEIARAKKVLLNVFVKPYSLLNLVSTENIEGIVVSYQNSRQMQEKSAQAIFGALPVRGILPVTAHENFPVNTSLKTNSLSRLQYGIPESVGMSSQKLAAIDVMMKQAIDSAMIPGAQVLVARKGKVIYHKAFGKPTYNSQQPVRLTDIYDVASMTKILATLPLVMELEEAGKVTLQTRLKTLLPELKNTNKADLSVLEILSHYAKLKPWIPFYIKTLDPVSKKPLDRYYQTSPSPDFNVKVAENLYMRTDYQDSIFKRVADTDLETKLEYKYSDLAFFILKRYIEHVYGKTQDKIIWNHLYNPLGAYRTGYNPLEKFSKEDIIPSEEDNYFRYQTIQGYVHDMGAAMQGGVGGHAGLFTTANDVAKIMQLYLQKGFYGGKRYFKQETIDKFNKCYYCENNNRRGVGFDKPEGRHKGPTCGCVSMTSFGHSGFTGTYTWADPESEIVYVFLSNRTYPTAENRKLITANVRTEVQQIIYDAIEE